jgi:hypothetical protein
MEFLLLVLVEFGKSDYVNKPGFEEMLAYLRSSNAFETEEGVVLRF